MAEGSSPSPTGSISDLGQLPTGRFSRRPRRRRVARRLRSTAGETVVQRVFEQVFPKTTLYLGISSEQYPARMFKRGDDLIVNPSYGITFVTDPYAAWRIAEATTRKLLRGNPIVVVVSPDVLSGELKALSPDRPPEVETMGAFQYYSQIPRSAIEFVATSMSALSNFAPS